MHEQTQLTGQYLSLTQVADIAPGRPSTNCVWRWCRRGVKSRAGERVRLQHVRMGGMIYTTSTWLAEFGQRLAEADARYFDLCEAASALGRTPSRRRTRAASHIELRRQKAIEEAERELDAAGI